MRSRFCKDHGVVRVGARVSRVEAEQALPAFANADDLVAPVGRVMNDRFQADIQYSLFAITVKEIFQKFSKNPFFLASINPY